MRVVLVSSQYSNYIDSLSVVSIYINIASNELGGGSW